MKKIKKFNADMFHLVPDEYKEYQIKEYIKDQQEFYVE